MKILGLNKDSTPIKAEDKSLIDALNTVLTDDYKNYQNENSTVFIECMRNPKFINDVSVISSSSQIKILCGTVQVNDGFVIFGLDINEDECIEYYIPSHYPNEALFLTKRIVAEKGIFKFNSDLAITGDFWYDWKKQLIIVFTDGNRENSVGIRYININNPLNIDGNENKLYETISISQNINFELSTKIEYPILRTEVIEGGNLKCGAYQIGICFKTLYDNYTNYSPLTSSIIIHGSYEDDYEVGDLISKSIKLKFKYYGDFNIYKLSLLYISEEGTLAYETDDINLSEDNTYTFSTFENLNSSSQEEILIKNINYIKAESLCNFNNRLLIGNLETFDNYKYRDKLLEIVNNLKFNLYSISPDNTEYWDEVHNYKNTELILDGCKITVDEAHFQTNEEYCFYAGFLNNRGDIVDIIHIPYIASNCNTNTSLQAGSIKIKGTNDDIPCHAFYAPNVDTHPQSLQNTHAKVIISLPSNINIPEEITSILILYAEHSLSNSRVLSNAFIVRDMKTNSLSNLRFEDQFISSNNYRVYPFEYLFNQIKNIECNFRFTSYVIPEDEEHDFRIGDNGITIRYPYEYHSDVMLTDNNEEYATFLLQPKVFDADPSNNKDYKYVRLNTRINS
jgi:hypothetical protein